MGQKISKLLSNFKDYLINAKMDQKNRKTLIVVISLLINVTIIGGAYFYITFAYFKPVNVLDKSEIQVSIPRNTSITKIANELESKGLIRNSSVFKYYVDFSDYSSKIRSGSYTLNKSMSMGDITKELTRGGASNSEISVPITEGMNINTIAKKLRETGIIDDEESFKKECNNISEYKDFDFIAALEGKTTGKRYVLEGYLFPDTYRFYTGSTNKEVITKMLKRFEAVVMIPEWTDKAAEQGVTIDQMVTIASIIEKESTTPDFGKVSAVIQNRLAKDQKLGMDSTINYITGGKRIAVTSEDLATESPYNTYKYAGLPPSAICNPGKNAFNFALNPDEQFVKDGYFFFCNGDPNTGELLFAKTAEEHNANQEKYRSLWIEFDKKNA